MTIVHKTTAAAVRAGLEFVMSDGSVDRVGDVIEPAGWQLDEFQKNPVALFSHMSSSPIGVWENVRVEGGKLLGRLKLAAHGTSERVDEIISLVQQGVLRAVSVGFRPIVQEPIPGSSGGIRFLQSELLEASLVAVPANANALQLAKSLNISPDTIRLVFGEHADEAGRIERGTAGEHAASSSGQRAGPMTLSKQIEAAQARLVGAQDTLRTHLDAMPDTPDAAFTEKTGELNETVKGAQALVANLTEAERQLAATGGGAAQLPGVTREPARTDLARPWAVPAKKLEPLDFLVRSAVIALKMHTEKLPYLQVLRETYGDGQEGQITKTIADIMVAKAAVGPADTVTPAWAAALVQTAFASDLMELLLPVSVYPGLSAKGIRVDFGRNGTVSIPKRDVTPTVAGSFVGEGAPIPVRRAGFSAITMGQKKMAVITTFTREISERSTPAIEGLLRNAIQEDTALSIDTVLLDANVATAIRPAGIRNGASTAAGTAGGGFNAIVADVKAMLGALSTATNGNIRAPVWLMNPVQAIALGLTQNAGGDFPFKSEVNGGNFQGYPLIQSPTVPAGVVILLDAADFATATGDSPRFDVSDQATLHMEDTAPAQISAVGTPNVVAAPVQSMFQTDSIALRMIMPMNWVLRRAGTVIERTAVTW